ncbi:MAG: 4'-phosphopantetheinyl transferase superfamily protein [Candidatus Ozemobacteraceae bacterium]
MPVVEIRYTDLRLEDSALKKLRELLSQDERDRCQRAKFPTVERRFLASRGMLRFILGETLHCDPREIQFDTAVGGKPFIAGRGSPPPFRFSASHSGDLFVVGLSENFEIGVDIERLRQEYQPEPIVKRFFSPNEYKTWLAFPENQRQQAFFRAWTRKEAYLKGTGKGIAGLQEIEISFEPNQSRALLSHSIDPLEADRWSFLDLSEYEGLEGFVGCLATPIPVDHIKVSHAGIG